MLYALYNALAGKPVLGALAGALNLSGKSGSLLKELGYIWQFYLPPLPGMHDYFHGFLITRVLWFNGLVGLYGWLDTTFPNWVYTAALVPAALIAALFARALYTHRGALRSRLVELCVYLAIVLGVAGVIGVDDYINHLPTEYAEPRYLLPLLALWGPDPGAGRARRRAPLGAGRRGSDRHPAAGPQRLQPAFGHLALLRVNPGGGGVDQRPVISQGYR